MNSAYRVSRGTATLRCAAVAAVGCDFQLHATHDIQHCTTPWPSCKKTISHCTGLSIEAGSVSLLNTAKIPSCRNHRHQPMAKDRPMRANFANHANHLHLGSRSCSYGLGHAPRCVACGLLEVALHQNWKLPSLPAKSENGLFAVTQTPQQGFWTIAAFSDYSLSPRDPTEAERCEGPGKSHSPHSMPEDEDDALPDACPFLRWLRWLKKLLSSPAPPATPVKPLNIHPCL